MDKLESMQAFVAVAQAGGFSAASRLLGQPLATVSRKVGELEASLGVRLLERSTRQVVLTDAGRLYLDACRRVLDDLRDADAAVSDEHAAPRGVLTITAPVGFGRLHVQPVVLEYEHLQKEVEDLSGIGISIGSHSCTMALNTYGGIRRIAILSPYWPAMNEQVKLYFNDMGFDVVRDHAMQARSWTGIAAFTTAQCREALRLIDGDDVDAIIQVGTNLSMVRLAAAAEMWLGKPVIAISTATYWHALRTRGFTERFEGMGRLLEEF
jgi:DNA-binding transcriptional LysR family regulator